MSIARQPERPSDGRLHDVAVESGVLSTDAVLGVLVGEVVLLVVELVAVEPRLLALELLVVATGAHVVAAAARERRVGVARLLLVMVVLVMVVTGRVEAAVVAGGARVIARTVQVVHAQHLDLLFLQALLLLRCCLVQEKNTGQAGDRF